MGPMISRNNTGTNTSAATTIEEIDSLRNTATTMSAWKLASILRKRSFWLDWYLLQIAHVALDASFYWRIPLLNAILVSNIIMNMLRM